MSLSFGGRRQPKLYDNNRQEQSVKSFRDILRRGSGSACVDEDGLGTTLSNTNDEENSTNDIKKETNKENNRNNSISKEKSSDNKKGQVNEGGEGNKGKKKFSKKIGNGGEKLLKMPKGLAAKMTSVLRSNKKKSTSSPSSPSNKDNKSNIDKDNDIDNDDNNKVNNEDINDDDNKGNDSDDAQNSLLSTPKISSPPESPSSSPRQGKQSKEQEQQQRASMKIKPKAKPKMTKEEREKMKELKENPPFGSRVKSCADIVVAKETVLKEYPGLSIQRATPGDKASQAVYAGANSVRAELIDMNSMVQVMSTNMTTLTHSTVEHFFDWFPPFMTYLERYMIVEDEFIIQIVEGKVKQAGGLKGELKPSNRMLLRGRIQRSLSDLVDKQDVFSPYLPAGQKLSSVIDACKTFTEAAIEYWSAITKILPPLIKRYFNRTETEKLRTKLVKHVVNHVGYKDFLAVYTRWMGSSELLEWKANVLLPCDFKFFSYSQWDKDMELDHYEITANFSQRMQEENEEDERLAAESKADFERAQAQRAQMEEVLSDEYDEEFDSDDGEQLDGNVAQTPRSGRKQMDGDKTPRSFLSFKKRDCGATSETIKSPRAFRKREKATSSPVSSTEPEQSES